MLLEAYDNSLLALLLNDSSNKSSTVCEGIYSLGATDEDQLVVLDIFNEHILLIDIYEGLVASMFGDAKVCHVLQRVAN